MFSKALILLELLGEKIFDGGSRPPKLTPKLISHEHDTEKQSQTLQGIPS